MEDLQDKIIELMDLFDGEVTTADKIDRPERALEKEAIDDFMKRNPMAGGGMLVQPSADGSRPEYGGKVQSTKHLGTTDKKYSGVYEETYKGGTKSYYGKYTRDGKSFKKNFKDKNDALKFVTEGRKKPAAKSVIELQKEGGTLLEQPKYKNNLARAMNEVNALQEKGYGNIDKIVKKYQDKFTQKIGTKTRQGKIIKKGTASTQYKAITFAIREQAKKLGIQSIKNENAIKALDAYQKLKTPQRGDLTRIAKQYNVPSGTFERLLTNLNVREKIPLQFGSEAEKKRYYYQLRKDAIDEFSSQKFEKFLSAPETSLVQKSHLGDLYNQYVRTGNLGYAPNLINQETLKDVDAILKEYNEQINDLFENKPKGYRNKIDLLNQKGTDLAAATQGYKKFTGRDPFTGKEFTINFSRPSQELDPGDLYGNRKLSELTTGDKITGVYDPKTGEYKKVDEPLLETMKKQSMKAAKLSKKEINRMNKLILSEVENVLENSDKIRLARIGCPGKATGGRVGYFEGKNLTLCAIKGAEKIKNDPLNLTGGDQQNLRALGKSAKAVRFLKNFLGPAAVAGELIFEGGFAANKFMSQGIPLKQALGESYINKYILGPKTQIDVEAERAKEFAKGEEFAMAKRGERMRPFMAQSATADAQRLKKREEEMKALYPQLDMVNLSNKKIDELLAAQGVYSPFTLGFGMQQKQPGIGDMRYNEDVAYDEIRDIFNKGAEEDIRRQQMQSIADAGGVANLAGGGIAKLAGVDQGPPPESGPNSQGLQGLMKRVKNI